MAENRNVNGQPIIHAHAAALAAGAKALREQAKPLAFEAHLAEQGLGDHYMRRALTQYRKLTRYAAELETLAGRRKGETK